LGDVGQEELLVFAGDVDHGRIVVKLELLALDAVGGVNAGWR
jgi:hypothetical protein